MKKQVNIRANDKTVAQIHELAEKFNMTQAEVVAYAVDMYHRRQKTAKSSGLHSPIYTLDSVYVECENDEDGIEVFQDVEYGPFFYKLRRARNFSELLNKPFFVEVTGDDLRFPYAVYDYEEKKPDDDDEIWEVLGVVDVTPQNWKPKYFQSGTLVATPRLGLI